MKGIEACQLTRIPSLNKLLLLNVRCDEQIQLSNGNISQSIIKCLEREYLRNNLTNEECKNILIDYFHINEHLQSLRVTHKLSLVKMRCFIDELVHDEAWVVRREIASKKYYLDLLTNDEATLVRHAVAEVGHNLHILKNDNSKLVRETAQRILNNQMYLDEDNC